MLTSTFVYECVVVSGHFILTLSYGTLSYMYILLLHLGLVSSNEVA